MDYCFQEPYSGYKQNYKRVLSYWDGNILLSATLYSNLGVNVPVSISLCSFNMFW
jgi:hypothetical protein